MSGTFFKAAFAAAIIASPAIAQSKSDVAVLQFQLHALGYDAGTVDGLWGGTTREALSQFFAASGQDFEGSLDAETIDVVARAFEELPKGAYVNATAYDDTKVAQNYEVFPYKEIACRAAFQAPWVGFNDLTRIQDFLAQSRCDNIWFEGAQYTLGDAVEGGVKLDIDGDGIRDLLVFFYGFQPNNPLSVLAFKMAYDPVDFVDMQLSERVSPIERVFEPHEVFADGNYPKVQNARFVSVADFNDDGAMDVFIADGGYDADPYRRAYPSKVFLSSPNGFVVEDVTGPNKTHGAAVGDVNGDGYVDIVLGRARMGETSAAPWGSSRVLLNNQGAGFIETKATLPASLQRPSDRQPIFVELLDVDGDGYLDLISGMPCGMPSKVFWNDGRGIFDEEHATVIPLPYPPSANNCDRSTPTTVDQVFSVHEEATGVDYLGVLSSVVWKGRYLTLHRVDGREFTENVATVPTDRVQAKHGDFTWALDVEEAPTGHVLNLFDFSFRRTRLIFDPHAETYRVELQNHEQNFRWTYDVDAIIGAK